MAHDLLAASYQDGELQEKYGNYLAPACRISVEGAELTACTGARAESVRVSLSLYAAASADFSVTDIWDEGTCGIKEKVKANLSCGKAIRVELGYGSEYVDVFHGFIYETGVQFSDMPVMQVTAMDVKRLMAENMRLGTVWNGKTVSDVFTAVMGDYSGFGLKTAVEKNGEDKVDNLLQRGSDLHLIQTLCRRHHLRFVVYGDQAKLTPKSTGAAVMKLSWRRELLSFSRNMSYVNVEITVKGARKSIPQKSAAQGGGSQGGSSGQGDSLKKTASVTSPGASSSGMPKTVTVIEMTGIEAESELEERLAEETESRREGMYSGHGSCVGMPVLIPGRYITIAGLDQDVDGEYYLKSVNHSFGTEGFTTDFSLGGTREE